MGSVFKQDCFLSFTENALAYLLCNSFNFLISLRISTLLTLIVLLAPEFLSVSNTTLKFDKQISSVVQIYCSIDLF